MGSTLTKDDLIKRIIKELPSLKECEIKLKALSMKDLWEIDRRITWLIKPLRG